MVITGSVDLPLDIFTEILSYLSLDSLLMTCRLNRLLLDLSLDFLYQEIYLDDTDLNIGRTFNTIIRDQLIANRVRRIYIFSRLSVPAESRCSIFTRNPIRFQEKFNNTLICLEKLRRKTGITPSDTPDEAGPPFDSVPDLQLSNVRELTITSTEKSKDIDKLTTFLTRLLQMHHVGKSLRRLEVVADTVYGLLLLIPTIRHLNVTVSDGSICNVHTNRNSRPCGITHLSIHFIPDRRLLISSSMVNKYLSDLLKRLASTLSSFSLSYASYPCTDIRRVDLFEHRHSYEQDFSGALEVLPHLPALKEFKFQAPFTLKTMKNLGALTEWLRAYQGQLEQLSIRATSLVDFAPYDSDDSSSSDFNTGNYSPGARYSNWLTSVEERGFLSLNFAMLHSLDLRLSTDNGQRVLPPLKSVAPSLKSLTLGYDDWLGQLEVENVLQGLHASREGSCGLETLRLRYIQLSPALLDLLHERLPRLRVLVLDCKRHMSSGGRRELSKRKYSWQLSHLKISTSSLVLKSTTVRHFHFHPHLKYMRMVADCLEGDPVLDMEFTCGCN